MYTQFLAILPELLQCCKKLICMRNPVLLQRCSNIARNCCCNIAAIAAILQETNLHAKSSIATTLRQYCPNIARNCCCNIAALLPQYCSNILPEGLFFDKGTYYIRKPISVNKAGLHQPASKSSFKYLFAGGPMMTRH